MKKLVLILALLIAIPGAAFGMEMLNDNALDTVTGQSGVNIVFDDIEMFINIDKMAYADTDGFDSAHFIGMVTNGTEGGALSIADFQIDTLKINAIVRGSNYGSLTSGTWGLSSGTASRIALQYNYESTARLGNVGDLFIGGYRGLEGYSTWGGTYGYKAKALTIDVADELPITSEAFSLNVSGGTLSTALDVGGVIIGVPTAEFSIPYLAFTPKYESLWNSAAAFNDGDDFGTIIIDGITFTTLNGWLEISPH